MSSSSLTSEPTEATCPHCKGSGKVTVLPGVATVEAYYFGCWNDAGHHWHCATRYAKSREIEARVGPVISKKIDTGFCYGSPKSGHDKIHPEVEGEAALHHIENSDETWTILSAWDRSVDKRPGSHSTFVALGKHDYATMIFIAMAQFPHIMNRMYKRKEIKLVESNT